MNNLYNPPYEFLGFKVLAINFHRENDGNVSQFSFQVIEDKYNEEDNKYNCWIKVKIQFENCEPSEIIFLSGYKINDLQWFTSLPERNRSNSFFSIVFPYIREKINSLCDDYRNTFKMPILDLRLLNVNQEIMFKAQK